MYKEWGELPYKVMKRKIAMKATNIHATENETLDDADIMHFKEIVDRNPNLYLDEMAFLFGIKTGKFVHFSTIRRCVVNKAIV